VSQEEKRRRLLARKRCQQRYPLRGQLCQDCFYAPARERHHEDGNPSNNAAANVRLVCVDCHGRVHSGDRWYADRAPDRWAARECAA